MKKNNKMIMIVVSNEGDFYDLIIYNCNAIYNYACMTFERLILL